MPTMADNEEFCVLKFALNVEVVLAYIDINAPMDIQKAYGGTLYISSIKIWSKEYLNT